MLTKDEYTKRLEEILQTAFRIGYEVGAVSGKDPIYEPNNEIYKIQQLNNEAIGEDVPLHQPFDDKYDYVEMGGWTIFRKGVNWYKQELRNILGASNERTR